MATEDERHSIYLDSFNDLSLSQADVVRIFNLGKKDITRADRNTISDKLNRNGHRAISPVDAFAMQALKLLELILQQCGEEVIDLEFDSQGRITKAYIDRILLKIQKNNMVNPKKD